MLNLCSQCIADQVMKIERMSVVTLLVALNYVTVRSAIYVLMEIIVHFMPIFFLLVNVDFF